MNTEKKFYKTLSIIYTIFSFLPLGYLIFKAEYIPEIYYAIEMIFLVVFQIMLGLCTKNTSLFYEFNSYCENEYVITNFDSDPRELKNSALAIHMTLFFAYFVVFIFNIRIIELYTLQSTITVGLILAIINQVFSVVVIAAYFVRLKKFFDYMNKTESIDRDWTQARYELKKVINSLTFDNHNISLTAAAYKDTPFMEFKERILERVRGMKSYNSLSKEQQLIFEQYAVEVVNYYLVKKCVKDYVE